MTRASVGRVREAVAALLARRRPPRVVHECRRCGTTVDVDASTCPTCDAAEIVRYEIR